MVRRGPCVQVWLSLLCTGLLAAAEPAIAADVPADRVAQHLAAGEFGAALEQAAQVADPAQQAELLKQVAASQQQAGAGAAARATLRRIADTEARARAQGQAARQGASLAGGGSLADFTQLMQLIQENTSGQWEQIDGVGGTMTPFFTGVRVSPEGVLSRVTTQDNTGNLAALAAQARKASLNDDMAQPSSLRLVSLARLEHEVAQRLADGLPVPQSMANFAGLSRVQYVFVDADAHDVILGGPAEAWQYNEQGQPVGVTSGRPTLQLDDFVTVLRTFLRGEGDFGCSINTRDEGVKALQEYVQQSLARGPLPAGSAVRNFVNMLQKKLGRQDVVVWGIPADSRVARVIVEADYRMKLIGIDKLDAGKSIPSYFDLLPLNLQKDPPNMEALRWWLTMKYDAVYHSPDRAAFEIQGASVKCLSENQMLTAEGKHLPTGKAEPINRLFASNFTSHYADLAQRDLVFADTQNVFDLALVAALIRHERLEDRTGIEFGVFAQNGGYVTARYPVPRELDSVVNHRVYNGRDIVVQVAGGVRADLLSVVQNDQIAKESPRLAKIDTPQLPAGRWWWDAAK
uniref:DUF1598 domain-containing protein n=1 Tax=Schlesneria paludicola TaxID=360056 RepID=A0A7C2JXK9_9PLAN